MESAARPTARASGSLAVRERTAAAEGARSTKRKQQAASGGAVGLAGLIPWVASASATVLVWALSGRRQREARRDADAAAARAEVAARQLAEARAELALKSEEANCLRAEVREKRATEQAHRQEAKRHEREAAELAQWRKDLGACQTEINRMRGTIQRARSRSPYRHSRTRIVGKENGVAACTEDGHRTPPGQAQPASSPMSSAESLRFAPLADVSATPPSPSPASSLHPAGSEQ